MEELLSKIKECGISKIITACTDLNLIITKNNLGIEILDSSEELAKTTVNNYLKCDGVNITAAVYLPHSYLY